jgi:hypothetical protein
MRHRLGLTGLSLLAAAALPVPAAHAADECTSIKLDFGQASVVWVHLPLSKLKRDTVYSLMDDNGQKVVHAEANSSASLYATRFKSPMVTPATLSWRWKTDALVAGADNRDKKREDAPLRIIVAFDGDKTTLPEAEQKQMKRARMLSGREPPYATLMYVWSEQVPLDTVIPSAHTSQLKMIVAASGPEGLGAWQSVRRNVAEDYQRAFGNPPERMIGVGVMTDSDNTGTKASGDYADLRFSCRAE